LQGFRPLLTTTLQSRILTLVGKPRNPADFRVVHGRRATLRRCCGRCNGVRRAGGRRWRGRSYTERDPVERPGAVVSQLWRVAPVLVLRRQLQSMGYRFRLQHRDPRGQRDVALPGRRAIIDARGCFGTATPMRAVAGRSSRLSGSILSLVMRIPLGSVMRCSHAPPHGCPP
jgi:hypothetical protein